MILAHAEIERVLRARHIELPAVTSTADRGCWLALPYCTTLVLQDCLKNFQCKRAVHTQMHDSVQSAAFPAYLHYMQVQLKVK